MGKLRIDKEASLMFICKYRAGDECHRELLWGSLWEQSLHIVNSGEGGRREQTKVLWLQTSRCQEPAMHVWQASVKNWRRSCLSCRTR
eukprot:5585994-Amphidinium_carterae.2